jgi:hypothetical protein
MAWIQSHQELGRHPKTRRAARQLGITLPAMVGHLQFLWWWCLDYADDGDLSNYDDIEIAEAALWTGDATVFMDALTMVGFIDSDGEDGRGIHDWAEYSGMLVQRRRANAEKQRNWRERHSNIVHNHDVTVTSPLRNGAREDNSRVENSREENSNDRDQHTSPGRKRPRVSVPPDYSAEFESFWKSYPRHIDKGAAWSAWKARLKSGVSPGDLVTAAVHYSSLCERESTEERYVKHAATFLGRDEPYTQFIAGVPEPERPGRGGNHAASGLHDGNSGSDGDRGSGARPAGIGIFAKYGRSESDT